MTQPAISIVMSTYNRAHLLQRSLDSYMEVAKTVPLELIIIDDASEDFTDELCIAYMQDIDDSSVIRYIRPGAKPTQWRDCAATINIGIRAAAAPLIICTHPEVIVGPDTVRCAIETAQDNVYICARPIYLNAQQQKKLVETTSVYNFSHTDYLTPARLICSTHPAPPAIAGGVDYSPAAVAAAPTWESWVWGGMTRATWRAIGGMTEHNTWGTVDVAFYERRKFLCIPNHTMSAPMTWVIHQNHDLPYGQFTPTNRDMRAAMANVPVINEKTARQKHVQ